MIDTSNLVQNTFDLLNSKRTVCFAEKHTEMLIAIDSPKNTILSKLFYEKTELKGDQIRKKKSYFKSDHCLFGTTMQSLQAIQNDLLNRDPVLMRAFKNALFVVLESEFNFYLMFISQLNFLNEIWLLKKGIQEFNAVLYYNLRNPINTKMAVKMYVISCILAFHSRFFKTDFCIFLDRNYHYYESGLNNMVIDCMNTNTKIMYEKHLKVFDSVDSLINSYSSFSDLVFINFRTTFCIYFFLLVSFLSVFVISGLNKIGWKSRISHFDFF